MSHPIYHITHYTNLTILLTSGGLLCDRVVAAGTVKATGIAHQHIKDRRAGRKVERGPGGTLADYVPFYFAPRSPMLLAIHRGMVEGYAGGQREVVHVVTTAERVSDAALQFVFTDGHAEWAISGQFDDLVELTAVDWSVMPLTYWHDTVEDPDRKRRRQAEFLVHQSFPWGLVTEIGVRDQAIAGTVQAILDQAGDPTAVIVRPEWYY